MHDLKEAAGFGVEDRTGQISELSLITAHRPLHPILVSTYVTTCMKNPTACVTSKGPVIYKRQASIADTRQSYERRLLREQRCQYPQCR
jgi:hypothetical protein